MNPFEIIEYINNHPEFKEVEVLKIRLNRELGIELLELLKPDINIDYYSIKEGLLIVYDNRD